MSARRFAAVALACALAAGGCRASGAPDHAPARTLSGPDDPWLALAGRRAPGLAGNGRHVVLLAGDEEYRSEEALPMLARLLAARHGFDCTVLFATDPDSGAIDPEEQVHVPGLERLADADLVVCAWRFRELPDHDMAHFVRYVESGKPLIGLRTATHAFAYTRDPESPYAHYDWRSAEWPGGFGRQVLGDTWIAHHGAHGRESTRAIVEPAHADHPILRGVSDVWGPTDVYALRHLPERATVLLRGLVLDGMEPTSARVDGPKNDPPVPVVWTLEHDRGGRIQRVVTSTLGAATDFESAGLRRVLVNAVYWCQGLEQRIDPGAPVEPVGTYAPTDFGFGGHREGVRAYDHALAPEAAGGGR